MEPVKIACTVKPLLSRPLPDTDWNDVLAEFARRQNRIRSLNEIIGEDREWCEAAEQALDEATRPAPAPVAQKPIVIPRGYEYRGVFCRCANEIQIYLGLLRHLLEDFPDKRDAIAAALGARSNTRAFLAQSPTALFSGKTAAWCNRYSKRIVHGWYADTNLNHNTKVVKARRAVKAAGLCLPGDVKINWSPRRVGTP